MPEHSYRYVHILELISCGLHLVYADILATCITRCIFLSSRGYLDNHTGAGIYLVLH